MLPAHGSPAHYERTAKSIDLFAAETAGSIGEVLGRLNLRTPRINACVTRFVSRCEADIFSVFEASCPCDWWETGTMNWNPVCMGNIGICAYYLNELAPENMTDARYEAVRKRVLASLYRGNGAYRRLPGGRFVLSFSPMPANIPQIISVRTAMIFCAAPPKGTTFHCQTDADSPPERNPAPHIFMLMKKWFPSSTGRHTATQTAVCFAARLHLKETGDFFSPTPSARRKLPPA